METMISGVLYMVSKIRGNADLITDSKCGFLHELTDIKAFIPILFCIAYLK